MFNSPFKIKKATGFCRLLFSGRGDWLSVVSILLPPSSPPPFAVGAILGTYSSPSLGAHSVSIPPFKIKKATGFADCFFRAGGN
jgi:hypothetical protein